MDTHQLYLAFINKYPFLTVNEDVIKDFVKQYPQITNSSKDLEKIKDYILPKDLEDEIELYNL